MSDEVDINWEAIAKNLQKDLEAAQIKLAVSMKPSTLFFLPDIEKRWNRLSYIEKVATVILVLAFVGYVVQMGISIAETWKHHE